MTAPRTRRAALVTALTVGLSIGAAQAETPVSALDEIFSEASGGTPYPFEALVAALNARIAPAQVRTALIPIGRSLQRFSADPDYFVSPRIVVAVDQDAGAGPALKDRVFLGFQPASGIIEAIAFSEESGQFEFRTIEDYSADQPNIFAPVDRDICLTCHQGGAPIFSAPLWDETNGNPAISARLTGLGDTFHGIPVRRGIDEPDAFDQSVARANDLIAAQWLWREVCDPGDRARRCRTGLLTTALRFRLGGDRAVADHGELAETLQERLNADWPQGFALADFQIPSRNPAVDLEAGIAPGDIVQAAGVFDPETARPSRIIWPVSGDRIADMHRAVRSLAMLLPDRDIAAIASRLMTRDGERQRFQSACVARLARHDTRPDEVRFDCETNEALQLSGFVQLDDERIVGGRIDTLRLVDRAPLHRVQIADDTSSRSGNTLTLALHQGTGAPARLATGERLSSLTLALDEPWAAITATISVIDDVASLDTAIEDLPPEIFAEGPFQRRVIVAALLDKMDQGS